MHEFSKKKASSNSNEQNVTTKKKSSLFTWNKALKRKMHCFNKNLKEKVRPTWP
jgi:hypothetical protein